MAQIKRSYDRMKMEVLTFSLRVIFSTQLFLLCQYCLSTLAKEIGRAGSNCFFKNNLYYSLVILTKASACAILNNLSRIPLKLFHGSLKCPKCSISVSLKILFYSISCVIFSRILLKLFSRFLKMSWVF